MIENKLLKSMQYRHATKEFNAEPVLEENLKTILEAGRLSPSSFGLEQWKFIVVKTQDLKDKLQKASMNQVQIGTSAFTVVILAKNKDMRYDSNYVQNLLKLRLPQQVLDTVLDFYKSFTEHLTDEQLLEDSKKQGYIAAANMMTMGAYLGIDSCPIGGFDEEEVLKILELDKQDCGISMLLPFGYKLKDPRPKMRLSFEEVIEFR